MRFRIGRAVACILLVLGGSIGFLGGAQAAGQAGEAFAPLEQWRSAILSHDVAMVRAQYSAAPPARVNTPDGDIDAASDAAFWTGLKARTLKIEVLQSISPQPGLQQIVFQAEIRGAAPLGSGVLYVSGGQLWRQQAGQWRLIGMKRTPAAHLQQPVLTQKEIYPANADARSEIKHALALAAKDHKRVLVVFGANWCYDCHVLDLAFHRPDIAPLLQRDFEVAHVDVGQGDKNQDLMQQYQVPMKRGIPALAVLDSDGKLLFSQEKGEFENARALAPADLFQFLNRWKPEMH
jgi:thioredoxin 1